MKLTGGSCLEGEMGKRESEKEYEKEWESEWEGKWEEKRVGMKE